MPSVAAMRMQLAWTGWRKVRRFTDYRPGSNEVLLLCEKTDELAEATGLAPAVTAHRRGGAVSEPEPHPAARSSTVRAARAGPRACSRTCAARTRSTPSSAPAPATSARASARSTSSSTSSSSELNAARARLGPSRPRRLLLLEGPRRPGAVRRAPSLGVMPTERLLRLRRLGGLDGHPERRRAGHRGELRLARHGHLEGTRHRVGEAAAWDEAAA